MNILMGKDSQVSEEAHGENVERSKVNILKCRDDIQPVFFTQQEATAGPAALQFVLSEDSTCSWARPEVQFGPETLRPRIEPWLTALCQSEHLSLLLGSGLSHAVHRLGTGNSLPGMNPVDFGEYNDVLIAEARKSAKAAGREGGNIEDQIRVANELLRGLEILGASNEQAKVRAEALSEALAGVLAEFARSIASGEQGLILADEEKRGNAFNYLVSFLMSFASRTGTRDRLHIFTTNYDRIIEAGAEVAGLRLLDRFVGSLAPIFRSSRLDLDH